MKRHTGNLRQQYEQESVRKGSVSERKTRLEAKVYADRVSHAKSEVDRGSEPSAAPREQGRQSRGGFSAPRMRHHPSSCQALLLRPELFQTLFNNGWNSAQRVIPCCVVLLFQYNCHSFSPTGVTMIGAIVISHSNALCLKSTSKLFSPQSTSYKNVLVQTGACALRHTHKK